MRNIKTITAVILSAALISPVLADSDDASENRTVCTPEAITAADTYDPGMSSVTTCLQKRNNVNVIVAWNNNQKHGKTFKTTGATVGQQIINARNLVRDYENNYGMGHGDEFDVVVVAYAAGVDWLRGTSELANIDKVNWLMSRGVKIYACQNTMKAKGLKLADLIPGVETVPAGVSGVVDFQLQGRTYLLP